ncbi:unnamed protein product, partial [Symbiodinium sp. CCMP2456]
MQGFKVKVNHVDWGEVRGRDEAGELVTSNGRPYMNVYLELANRSDKTFQFKSWYGNEFTTQNGAIRTAQLSDDDKNMYYPLKFDDLADLKWWTPSKTFDPLEEGTDCIVFDVPEDFDPNKVENLYLDLPGEAVRVLGRSRYPELEKLNVECVQGDLRERADVEKAVKGCEVVYHVAALAGIWGRWKDYHGINVLGTQNVIDACLAWNVERLVYCSSPSVTFNGTDQKGVDESAAYPETWLAHYPHSKALGEQAVLAAHRPGALATCALRPHLIWGPRDQHLIPRLIERAKTGKLRIVGDGKNLVDMVFVENAAAAHVQAASALASDPEKAGGKAYFITQGAP